MENLLFEQESDVGFIFIGNGYALKKTPDEHIVHLYKNGCFVKEQVLNPSIEKRIFVVDLIDRHGVTKSKLALALKISRQSIDNWLNIYRKHGISGLINNTKDSWKKNPKRFTGNSARDLEKERLDAKQELEKKELKINFEKELEVEEKHCGPAKELYSEEFDYQENRYGGSMLYLAVMIKKHNYLNQLSSLIGNYLWIPLMFVMMHVNKILSVEQFKIAYKKEFGQVVGLKKLVSLVNVRTNIWELVALKQASKAMLVFFKTQIINGIVSIWRIFLDGHFVPYSGKEKTHKAQLAKLDADKFTGNLDLNDKSYVFFETKKTYRNIKGDSIELRRVVTRNTKTGETFAIVTNDKIETTKTIVDSMLNRWGNSENGFKHLGDRTNMHYNPAWDVNNESCYQEIANPEYIALKKKLKGKKAELASIQKELGQKEPKPKKDGTPRKTTVREEKIRQRDLLGVDIKQINMEISECPERIETKDKGLKPFKKIDDEAKKWWNSAEMIFWNTRKNLSKLLYNYLPDNRDLLPVLDAITGSRGWVKSTKEMLAVRLEPLETPRFRDAQIQLCRHINNQNIKLPNGKLLQYDVGKNPYNVQK